jgi:hypothetical protein
MVMCHHKTLYGPNGSDGLVSETKAKADKQCLENYMKRMPPGVILTVFIGVFIPIILTGIRVWSQQEVNPLLYATKQQVVQHNAKIGQLEIYNRSLLKEVESLKTMLDFQNAELKKDIRQLSELVQDSISHQRSFYRKHN